MQLIQQKRDTSHGRERNREQDHKDDLWKGFQELQEPAYCSYQLETLSCLQPNKVEQVTCWNDDSFGVNLEIAMHAGMIKY